MCVCVCVCVVCVCVCVWCVCVCVCACVCVVCVCVCVCNVVHCMLLCIHITSPVLYTGTYVGRYNCYSRSPVGT